MPRRILKSLKLPPNRAKMEGWIARVNRIVSKPAGSDDGLSPEAINLDAKVDFSKLSTWEIICEEMVDTQHSRVYFERAREELRRRGISEEEITEMRRFAWVTAGWLNFEKMLWDWVSLDEKDIYRAVDWQYSDGWITSEERDKRIVFAKKYDRHA